RLVQMTPFVGHERHLAKTANRGAIAAKIVGVQVDGVADPGKATRGT
ncbi:MAG: hypothetical protein QOH66_1807, partial [Actinomycetota bacterium]|nr:hypothetical protein [Actinomycetota bacterium]